jgi:sugar O-acyltransferase (sialic acid O-acetyltransferase NeuD family)
MSKPGLILIGAGGHARSCIDAIEEEGTFKIAGLVGLTQQVGTEFLGHKVIATDFELEFLAKRFEYAVISIGQIATYENRETLYNLALSAGFKLPTIISPSSYVSRHAKIGMGTIIMHSVIINAGASIGDNCIINTQALLEHDSQLGNHCHVSTGAILNGSVTVGDGSFIGSGAVIREGLTIGAGSIVGMGLTLLEDLVPGSKYLGKHT